MRDDQIETLRKLLRDLFSARYEGVPYTRLSRAHGYADGFMAALLRARVLTQRELLAVIAEERARVAGPATRTSVPAHVLTTIEPLTTPIAASV